MNELLLTGIIISLFFTEFTGLSPGGIIVPAYFAMYSYDPKRLIWTVLLAVLSVVLVKFLSRFMILYGRRRFAVYVLTGIFLRYVLGSAFLGASFSIGYLIPGILGRDMEKQGMILTLASLGIVTLVTLFISILIR